MYQSISVHKECSTRIVGVTSASFFEIFHGCHPLLSPPTTPLGGVSWPTFLRRSSYCYTCKCTGPFDWIRPRIVGWPAIKTCVQITQNTSLIFVSYFVFKEVSRSKSEFVSVQCHNVRRSVLGNKPVLYHVRTNVVLHVCNIVPNFWMEHVNSAFWKICGLS